MSILLLGAAKLSSKNLLWLLGGAAVLYFLYQKSQPQFTFQPTAINAPLLPTLPNLPVAAPAPPAVNFVAGTSGNVASGYTPDYSTYGIG